MSTTEEQLASNSSEIRHADHVAPSIRKKLALTSLTSGGRSVGIVHLWTEAMEFFLCATHTDDIQNIITIIFSASILSRETKSQEEQGNHSYFVLAHDHVTICMWR
jgi:hypothetical protein